MVLPLNDIPPGETVRILYLGNDSLMSGRLQDLGFEVGATISCVLQRPKKNIAAYLVRNAVIALRKTDSRLILAEPVTDADMMLSNASSIPQANQEVPKTNIPSRESVL